MTAPQVPHPPRRRRKIFRWLAALALIFATTISYLYFHDTTPPDDADLCSNVRIVPDGKNGLLAFQKISVEQLNLYSFTTSRGLDDNVAYNIYIGRPGNDAFIAGFLIQTQPTIEDAIGALASPYFEFPHSSSSSAFNADTTSFRVAGKAFQLAARAAEDHGDFDSALKYVALTQNLAGRLLASHGSLFHVSASAEIEQMGLFETARLLNNSHTSAITINSLRQIYQDELDWTSAYQEAYRFHYQMLALFLDEIKTQQATVAKLVGPRSDWYYQLFGQLFKVNASR